MVNTVKFSQFVTAPLTNANNEVVGLESGVNVQSVRFLSWTTAGRPATPFNGLLGINTSFQEYEYWDAVSSMWVQLAGTNILPLLASHAVGEGASLVGLQNQSHVTNKTVQDLANATFIAQTDNGTLQNAQFLGSLTTGIVKNTTVTGVLSISAPLTSIDGLTTVANEFLITTAPNTYATLGPLTNGQLIIGSTGLAPALATLTQGSGVTITNGAGTITISATGSGGTVTSLTAGTGITLTPSPITTTGSIALTIPVVVTSGGTGLITITSHNLMIGNGTSALTLLAPSATSGIPLISQGAAADPAFGTAVVSGGGTGNTTFTAFSVICAGTTATGAFQNVSGVGTLNQVLVSQGAGALPQWGSVPGLVPAALTKTDDTNVTLTLGGTPATALLQATSLTLGWAGQLSLARGGSNASLTASNGGIVYSTATAMAILSGTATAGQIILSGANAAPSWSTATYPATAGTSGNVLTSNGTNWTSAAPAAASTTVITDDTTTNATMYPTWVTANTGSLPLKVSSTKLSFNPSTAVLTLAGGITGLTSTISAPTAIISSAGRNLIAFNYVGSAVNYLQFTNNITGSPPGISVAGADGSIALNFSTKNSVVQIFDYTNTAPAILRLLNTASTFGIGLRSPAAQGSNVTFTLPGADGAQNQPLTTNGSGVLAFMQLPSCSVWNSTKTTIAAASVATKITFGTKLWDIGGYFDAVTNNRYTPLVPGIYRVSSEMLFSSANIVAGNQYAIAVYKNGSLYKYLDVGGNTNIALNAVVRGSCLVNMNGSTDFIELFGFNYNAATTVDTNNSSAQSYLDINYVAPLA